MQMARQGAIFDGLVELGGASAFALAIGFAASKLGPVLGYAPPAGFAFSALSFALALLAMRAVRPEPRIYVLADFDVAPIETDDILELTEVAEEPLLLDTPYEEPADAALLLVDALPDPDPASRVIQLFAAQPMPTPGQLKERIDRHLATGTMHVVREFEGPAPDAADALFAALNELKRSLR